MRAPDWWESARFQAVYVARSGFRQNSVISSRPLAGNASRWATIRKSISGQLEVKIIQQREKV